MAGIRERVRAELTSEIKRLAREQIAEHGAASLSLRAIARDLDMASSAVYRYFDSRDRLLTALIIDCYSDLGELVEAADAACDRDDLRGRWRATAHAIRQWALRLPNDYALIFGTPVPGYAAPQDTVGPATRYTMVLVRLLQDAEAAGVTPKVDVSEAAHRECDDVRARLGTDISDELLIVGMAAWTNLFGLISFELFGHLHNVVGDRDGFFAQMVDALGERVIPTPG
jgi:AcrR family transcriptional regulator